MTSAKIETIKESSIFGLVVLSNCGIELRVFDLLRSIFGANLWIQCNIDPNDSLLVTFFDFRGDSAAPGVLGIMQIIQNWW
jgi:hypothetical protein